MKATDLAVAAYFWNLNHCAHHLWTHPELPGDRGEASGPFSNWRRCSSSPCPSSGPPAMAAAPAHSCFGLCPPASPPPGKGGVEEGAAPRRFPLTTAWPAGPLGLGQASSGAWSRGPRSKPGPWQPLNPQEPISSWSPERAGEGGMVIGLLVAFSGISRGLTGKRISWRGKPELPLSHF